MTSLLCRREFAGTSLAHTRAQIQAPRTISFQLRRPCPLLTRAAPQPPEKDPRSPGKEPAWQQIVSSIIGGISVGYLVVVGMAVAGGGKGGPPVDPSSVMGPTSDMLLGQGPEFSFSSLLLFTLMGYWLIKSLGYLSQNKPDDKDSQAPGSTSGKQGQQGGGPGGKMSEMGGAPIRSMVDSSVPGNDSDARAVRNASLARGAAYRVSTSVREASPRIHTLVEELAGPSGPWPLQPPRNADVDFVAQMVYQRVLAERSARAGTAEPVLCPRERAALETALLEEVAEKCAAEQVAEFVRLAALGQLHPRGSGKDGAGVPPPSKAAH